MMMSIHVQGRRVRYDRVGRIAEFCPVCRNLTAFACTRVRVVEHFNYVDVGRGDAVASDIECEACRTRFRTRRSYPSIDRDVGLDIATLAEATNPRVLETIEARHELEARIRTNALTQEERFTLIRGAICSLSHHATTGAGTSVVGAIAVALTIALLIGGMIAMMDPRAPLMFRAALWSGVAVAGVIAGYELITTPARFMRDELYPRIARALATIRPTRREMEAVFATLREERAPIVQQIDRDESIQALADSGVLGG